MGFSVTAGAIEMGGSRGGSRLGSLSPFELERELIALAGGDGVVSVLNAGRGNPNWVATGPREAFFALGYFALSESRRVWTADDLGGKPAAEGSAARFTRFCDAHPGLPGVPLLLGCVRYGIDELGFEPDAWVHELADAVIGDNYPGPNRILTHCEQVIRAYLARELCDGRPPEGEFDIFATEGGTAAMAYLFDSLLANEVLHQGDKVALMTPLFPPYLEIPQLERYSFDVVHVQASPVSPDGLHEWTYSDEELAKLNDVKALCLINPSNPASMELAGTVRDRIVDITRTTNPDLVIVTDDVYGTFVPGFRSLAATAPRNTLLVYSYSKHYGCTGWRLGVIALHQHNVIDDIIARLPQTARDALDTRYRTLSTDPGSLKFIDRMVADSRQVALRHTAGLSTPQQAQQALFTLFDLQEEGQAYKRLVRAIVHRRLGLLAEGTGLTLAEDPRRAAYYIEIDVLATAARQVSPEFADHLLKTYEPTDILFRLAEQESVVLINGRGFDAPGWSVRVSLANLDDLDYLKIGHRIQKVLKAYVDEWKVTKATAAGA